MKLLFSVSGILGIYLVSFSSPSRAQVPDSLLAIPNDSVRALAIGQLAANTAFKEKDFPKAYALLEEAYKANQTFKSKYIRAKLLRERGIIEQSQENHAAAIKAYQAAYDAFKVLNDEKMQIDALIRLDQIYFNEHEFDLAENYIRQALSILKNNPSLPVYLLGDCYNELANINGEKGNQNKAYEYGELARKAYIKAGEENTVATTSLNTAITLRKLKRYDESVRRFKQVEAYAIQHKNDFMQLFVYLNLPNTLREMKNYKEALLVNQKALSLIQANPSLKQLRFVSEIHANFHKIYAAQQNYQKAYEHYNLAVLTKDSLTNLEKKREIARLETQFQTLQKEQKIQELGSENEAKQEQLLILLSILAGVVVFLGALFWQFRRLQQSKAKISEQSEQLKVLMKELHHRVKNNLAIVSSLLKLQSNRIEEESAARAVREGQQRVEAMSLIHQRLYQTDLLTSINMRDYIVDLTENLMMAYGYQLDNFDLRLNIEQEELDVDLAIPVGLILNELLTNSFKYAYKEVLTPMLSISLMRDQGLTLEIQDNGPGINESLWKQKGGSFGKRLIKNLSEQTGGIYQIGNNNGTHYKLHIAEQSLRKVA
jgi:two-component sensor histidine kinase